MTVEKIPRTTDSSAVQYDSLPPRDPTGGGGSTTYNQYTIFAEKTGPSSYTTGGFVIDLTSTFSSLNSFKAVVKKGTRGNVPFGRFEILLNSPTSGKVTVLVRKYQQEKVTAIGNVTGQPAGVTVQTSSGQVGASESSHTHDATHDHAAQASAAMTAGGAGVDTDAGAPAINTHTHSVDVPSMSVTTGAGGSHNHTDNSLYAHSHSLTHTATNTTQAELANATDLSATTFYICATGVRG